jgi:hypothetical protein
VSGALFSRIKNWGSTDTLSASDLNAEFDNILTNFKPQMMDSYSANQSQMQTQTNPGSVGAESLATALSGELERLRFQIAAITGNTYWYSTPANTISSLNTALGANTQSNSVTSGRSSANSSQALFVVPNGSAASVVLKATTTPLVYKIAGTSYTLSADVTISSLTTAPTTNNTVTINDTTLAGASWTKLIGENGSSITVSSMGSNVSALIGKLAAFKTAGSEYVICRVESSTQLTQVYRGYFFNSADSLLGRTTVTNGDSWTLAKLTWIYLSTAGAATVVYTTPSAGATAPSSPATGDYWFDTANNLWKTYNSTTWVASNTTLVGVCIQNTTACVAARSADFFKAVSDTNTVEIMTASTTQVRSRYESESISVYGTSLSYPRSFLTWDSSTNMDSGVTFSASTYYYLYIKENGDPVISDVAPFDRRADLKGFYHPRDTWRCVGYSFANGSTQFNTTNTETESFFRTDEARNVSAITSAVSSFPAPYIVPPRQEVIQISAAAGSVTQGLPPCSTWKGRRLIYTRTDASVANTVTLQAFGNLILSTTTNLTAGNTNLGSLASNTGLSAGVTYNVSASGIQRRATATWASGATATASLNSYATVTGGTIIFSTGQTISGNFQLTLNTQDDTVELYSDGSNAYVLSRSYPTSAQYLGTIPISSTGGTQPVKGTVVIDRIMGSRRGNKMWLKYEFNQSSTGTAGSDTLLIGMPTGYTIDINQIRSDATTNGSASAAGDVTAGPAFLNGYGWLADSTNTARGHLIMKVYNSTNFHGVLEYNVTTMGHWPVSAGNGGFNAVVGWAFEVEVPILGWSG